MSVSLEPLIYTSLPEKGFVTLACDRVDADTVDAFSEQIVARYWDAYAPPPPDFRAAIVHWDPASERTLFGWLFNDGRDEMGRANVPYFLCYCLCAPLDEEQLSAIFACLEAGPSQFIERRYLKQPPAPSAFADLIAHAALRPGIAVPRALQESAVAIYRKRQPIRLFAPSERLGAVGAVLPQERSGGLRPSLLLVASAAAIVVCATGFVNLYRSSATVGPRASVPSRPTVAALPPQQPWVRASERLLVSHTSPIWATAISPDGHYYAGGDATGAVKLWSADGGLVLRKLSAHRGPVRTVVFTPDGKTLVSAGSDQQIRLWNPATGSLLASLVGHTEPVWSLAISSDGHQLASGGVDRTIRLWDLRTGRLLRGLRTRSWTFAVAFSPDQRLLASGGKDHKIRLWDPATGSLLATLTGHTDAVRALDWSQDGRTLASASWDGTVALWDVPTRRLRTRLRGHRDRVTAVALEPDGKLVASGSIDGTVRFWQADSGRLLRTFRQPEWILSLKFSPDGHLLYGGIRDATLRVWQPAGLSVTSAVPTTGHRPSAV
ncbi:WD40 repeat domain-containing protein [Gloeobacter kilaueensis]|uniref:Uncharacterized protein n=1 Tax=Gloeobacter kilaueensis (strain ATCC BAA-2537 / CCAP 1431/1 / ULC 316 / JS1) TaxID=1183438 RepID=U5QLM1_GLOK1|nr:WD40 repeat domain-containing protein [Gloeobacter kilaueensis]AGY58509.1 hypothetical protein GKIL_2263 [Gloeobacter kilaueensis JS1]